MREQGAPSASGDGGAVADGERAWAGHLRAGSYAPVLSQRAPPTSTRRADRHRALAMGCWPGGGSPELTGASTLGAPSQGGRFLAGSFNRLRLADVAARVGDGVPHLFSPASLVGEGGSRPMVFFVG